jgi:hypothetical protein
MSDKEVEDIMKMAFCTEEEARRVLNETGDVIDAVCKIMDVTPVLAPKKKELNEEQLKFKEMRTNMERMDRLHDHNLTRINQHEPSCLDLTDTPSPTSQHSENIQSNHLLTQELEVEIPETVCQ